MDTCTGKSQAIIFCINNSAGVCDKEKLHTKTKIMVVSMILLKTTIISVSFCCFGKVASFSIKYAMEILWYTGLSAQEYLSRDNFHKYFWNGLLGKVIYWNHIGAAPI